ncbi:MAG: nitrous oxide-stimulated promoter family protein [Spirochaetes bacterium]|nr:nitrous oxide-stimulated promoter family protein [Spirochaetota bacterium]
MKTTTIDKNVQKDIAVLAEFIHIYCKANHRNAQRSRPAAGGALGVYLTAIGRDYCTDCSKLILHAASKRLLCPYKPKPACKKCPTHCYGPGYRERIREVMRYSGKRLIMRGRLGLIRKYFS